MLDTSVLVAVEKGKFPLGRILALMETEEVAVATITASELLHGVERAKPPPFKERRSRFVEWAISTFDIVEFGLAESRVHARLWAQLKSTGQIIGPHDMIIAATALHLEFSLATFNESEFRRVPGLALFSV